ncbi:MAG TPA: response regulator transcription factor [Candidatus Acidoferrales bacterium]|jgi:DNA-binding response OmpR family regulator|nr:response regulator transcription factor [Candidatus Acidoferrales bacterium]
MGTFGSSAAYERPRILVVEDERAMREMLVLALEREGYRVQALATGTGLTGLAKDDDVALVLLDIGLPGIDGISLVPLVRAVTEAPIMMLSARTETRDKVRALDAGADHYVTKPIDLDELLSRISAALRRPAIAGRELLSFAGITIDVRSRDVRHGERPIELTPREYALLEALMRTPGRAFSKDELLERVWGLEHEGDSGIVDRYVSYLRTKLEADGEPRLVQTLRGVGYVLRREPER